MKPRKAGPAAMTILVLLGTLLQTADAAQAPVTPAGSPAPARLADLSFMAGHWLGEMGGGGVSEEIWAEPAGDAMMGMWRWLEGDRTRLYEFLTIRQEGGALVFRLRHFNPDGTGWEEKDQPVVLPLASHSREEAVFEGTGSAGTLRISYRRDGDDGLTSVLERGSKTDLFRFKRKR